MYLVVMVTVFDFNYYWLSLCLLLQIFKQDNGPKTIIYVSGIGSSLLLFYSQTTDTLVTAITKIHNKQTIQTLSTYYLVF